MSTAAATPITRLLAAVERGEPAASDRLWSAIYHELHAIARAQMAREAPGRTLQPTALIHEAWLRMIGENAAPHFANRRAFFAAAANVMRRIRTDDARRRKRLKRGAGRRVPGSPEPPVFDPDPAEVLAVDDALNKLERQDPHAARVVTLRYFAGLTIDETAEALGCSPRKIDEDWRLARAWLHREIGG